MFRLTVRSCKAAACRLLLPTLFVLWTAPAAFSDKAPAAFSEEAPAAFSDIWTREALEQRLADYDATAEDGVFTEVAHSSLDEAFPGYRFFVFRFRSSVNVRPPEPLADTNLFIVRPDQAIELVNEPAMFQKFFMGALAGVENERAARIAAMAWQVLVQALRPDGFR
jgi:hypothetical protein